MKITTNVDKVISQLTKYSKSLDAKIKSFAMKLGDIGYTQAFTIYQSALYAGTNDVVVREPYWAGDTLVLEASGESVTFIEFGTGTWAFGSDIHPLASQFGYERGEYGYGLGKLMYWRYEGDPGNAGIPITQGKHAGEIMTFGNPPAKAMYLASKEMRESITKIAKEVFA